MSIGNKISHTKSSLKKKRASWKGTRLALPQGSRTNPEKAPFEHSEGIQIKKGSKNRKKGVRDDS